MKELLGKKDKSELLLEIISHKETIISAIQSANSNVDVSGLVNEVVGMTVALKAHKKGGTLNAYIRDCCKEKGVSVQNKSLVIGMYAAGRILG